MNVKLIFLFRNNKLASEYLLYRMWGRCQGKKRENPGVQLKRKYVKQPEKICFEGTEVKCPKEIEEYLHDNYGDYHKLPPENERKGHAPYQVRV